MNSLPRLFGLFLILATMALALLCLPLPTQREVDRAQIQAAYQRAETLRREMKLAAAIEEYQKSLKLAETNDDTESLQTALILNQLGLCYATKGSYAESEPLFERSLHIRETALGKEHVDVAASLYNLAFVYQMRKQYAKAEPLYLHALTIWEANLGKDHLSVANALSNLATVYRAMVQYRRAEPLYERALAICESRLGKDHLAVAILSTELAGLYHDMGEYARAEPLHRRALAIREAQLGKDHLAVAVSLHNLAALYRDMGRYAEAEPLCQRALAIRETKLGKDQLDVATSLDNLARIYQATGQYTKAEPLHQRALAIRETRLGMKASVVGFSLNNLATLYQEMGQYTKAEPLYQRALTIQEAQFSKDHPEVATILGNLGRLYYAMRRFDEAETLCTRALAIREAQLGASHPAVASSLDSLALVYWRTDQPARAEPLFQRSLAIREARYGKDHPGIGVSLNNLALVYSDMGKYAEAEPLLQRSLAISETRFGGDHPDLATTLYNLGLLRERQGRTREAVALFERSRRVVARHVARVLPILAESEQLAFLQNKVECPLHVALSLAARHPDDPEATAASAGWLLNTKGVAQQTLAQATLLVRDSKDPALADLTRQLLDVRQQLAHLALAIPKPGQQTSLPRRIQELNAQEADLANRLRRGGSGAVRADSWVELRDVQRKLSVDAVFIDITRMPVLDFQASKWKDMWGPVRCIAWLTRAEGEVRLVDLGPADRIDTAVRDVRKALEVAPRLLPLLGETESERRLRKPLDALSRLVLHPLLKHVDASRSWIISPDGNLWLVPWEALTLPDGTYAIEKHQIRYAVSGRDLASDPSRARVRLTLPLVLADPDFDLGLKEARAETRHLLPEGEKSAVSGIVSRSFVRGRVQRLPGTADEARAIAPWLKSYAGAAPHIYLERQALEGVFKAARSPRVVVLSTHGFFLPDQEMSGSEETLPPGLTEMPRTPGKASESPLLRCGLLLAGCNSPLDDGGGDDGVLTGLEVVGTDLRGTELVVLSACQTGLGEVRNGEGVAGLRQAFQLAGAEAVLATLWPVADKESAQLMSQFFENLAKGQRRASALHNAQLQMITVRRREKGAAHPFFWAAFTLTDTGDCISQRRMETPSDR